MTQSYSSPAEAERHADEAREDLARTIAQIKDNLTPRRLAGEAMAATRAHTPDWIGRFWETARSPAGLALIGVTAASVAVTMVQNRRHPSHRRTILQDADFR